MNHKTIVQFAILLLLLAALAVGIVSCSKPYSGPETKPPAAIEQASMNGPTTPEGDSVVEQSIDSGDEVNLTSSDGFRLSGDLYNAKAPKGVVLLHMLGKDRSTYGSIVQELSKSYAVLAIDMRGHGKSQGDVNTFGSDDVQAMQRDIEAAVRLLGARQYALIGASIGANLALNYAAGDPAVRTVVLLSPGMGYRGISIKESAAQFNRPVLAISSMGDSYSASSVDEISSLNPRITAQVIEGSSHGTDMLDSGSALRVSVVNWVKANMG